MDTITVKELADLLEIHPAQVASYIASKGVVLNENSVMTNENIAVAIKQHYKYTLESRRLAQCDLMAAVYTVVARGGKKGATAREVARRVSSFNRLGPVAKQDVMEQLEKENRIQYKTITMTSGQQRKAWVAV